MLVIGCTVTACELVKNLALAGVGKFTLLDDDRLVTDADAHNNFYVRHEDIGKNRAVVTR